jgi:hypothetical protein
MSGFERYTRKTRRAAFLEEMEQVVPWRELCALVEPYYPKPGNARPPVGVERMLHRTLALAWLNLTSVKGAGLFRVSLGRMSVGYARGGPHPCWFGNMFDPFCGGRSLVRRGYRKTQAFHWAFSALSWARRSLKIGFFFRCSGKCFS